MTTYHADANIIVGQADAQRGTRTAHVLEAALQHPRDVCRSLLRMLLRHGASLLDTSTHTITQSLLFLAMKRDEDALDIFAELDSENFTNAITKSLWVEFMISHSALTGAIQLGLENTALKLLSYGAPPHIDFNSSLEIQTDSSPFGKKTLEAVEGNFWQPILSAALNEMPRLVMDLLDRGADPKSRLTDHQARYMLHHRDCRSVMDIVKAKLIELRNWHKEDESVNWDVKGTPDEATQLTGKESVVARLINEYEEAEAKLVSLGAQISDGLNLQDPQTPVSLRPRKRVQLHAPSSTETQTLEVTSKKIDFRKLETLEDGHTAL